MLNVFAADWCPHCRKTVAFLNEHRIAFDYHEIDNQPESVIRKIIDVNGGIDWVVPTLEYRGAWRAGKAFDPRELKKDLIELGVIES